MKFVKTENLLIQSNIYHSRPLNGGMRPGSGIVRIRTVCVLHADISGGRKRYN